MKRQTNTDQEFGAKLRRARKERGLTLKGLNELTGISISTISEIERNITSVRWRQAIWFADSLEQSLDYFAGVDAGGSEHDMSLALIKRYQALPANMREKVDEEIRFLSRATQTYKKSPGNNNSKPGGK